MKKKLIILLLATICILNAKTIDENSTKMLDENQSKIQSDTFINVISNVKDTMIYLNNEYIGNTPIKLYPVPAYQNMNLTAKIDKNYYEKDLSGTIRVRKQTMPTYSLKFKKAKAKLFFIGEDADLHINGKFIKKLNATNRVVTVIADKNVSIKIINQDNDVYSTMEDIQANTTTNIPYKIKPINNEIKLFTTTIGDNMWEDTKEAATKATNWKQAKKYCKKLELGDVKDWYVPTIDQLNELYENRDKIYHGFGGAFYWSDDIFSDKKNIWNYSYVKDFEEGETKTSVKEFAQGRIRCVRDIISDIEQE